jgi:hypothetical protein
MSADTLQVTRDCKPIIDRLEHGNLSYGET